MSSSDSRRPSAVRSRSIAVLAAFGLGLALVPLVAPVPSARADTTTSGADNLRTGWYPTAGILPQTVAQGGGFGQQASTAVDGQVYAQPLVSNGTLLVATENNKAYGLSAKNGSTLWTTNLGTPFVVANYHPTAFCGDISPNVGVTSTPVVDPASGVEYLTSKTLAADGATPEYFMHALSVATGAEQPGFPVQIQGTADNDPGNLFNAGTELQRPGLLLSNGVVYAGFGGHCDAKPFQGWIFGVSTAGRTTARWTDEVGIKDGTGGEGGIWQSGGGLLSDATGQLIFTSGNGVTPSAPTPGSSPPGNLGQSVGRLTVQADGTLKTTDFFTPYNGASLNSNDSDLGAGAPVELPAAQFGTTAHPHVIIEDGKAGYIYVLDADHLGGYAQGPSGSDAVVNTVPGYGLWGKPSVWPGDGGYVYMVTAQGGGGTGALRAYKYGLDGSGNPTVSYQGKSTDQFGFGSSTPIVTSDGTTNGSALVWTIWAPNTTGQGAQLRAYSAVPGGATMALVNSFPVGTSNKFTPPTADNGHVYVGTRDGHVLVFGSPVASPLTGAVGTFPPTTVGSSSTQTATLTATEPLTVTSVTTSASTFTTGAPAPALPATLATGATITVPVTFTPGSTGLAAASLQLATSAGAVSVPMSGQGRSASPHLSANPTCCLSFGGVQTGTSGAQSVTYTNDGAATLHVTSVNVPSAPYTVTGLPAVGGTIAPGASVTASVTFSPKSVGYFTNELTLATDGGTVTTSLDGAGGTAPKLEISATALEYGTVPSGVTATNTFAVRNSGGTPVTITLSKPPHNDDGFTVTTDVPESTTLQPGDSITARVAFTPPTTGDHTSSWVLNANDGVGERTISFHGVGGPAPTPTALVGDVDVAVPAAGSTTTAAFPVLLAPGALAPVTAAFATHDGSAKSATGAYTRLSGSVTATPGAATTIAPVTVNGTGTATATSFSMVLTPTASVKVADTGVAYLNTTPTTHSFVLAESANAWSSPSESTTATVPVVLQKPATAALTVTATTADGTAKSGTDYTALTKAVTIAAGQTEVDVPVTVLAHASSAGPSTFTVVLSGARGATKIAAATATVTIYPPTANVSVPPPPTPLAFTADTPATTGTVNANYAYSFGASGYPHPTFAVVEGGNLPDGLELDPTGILAGDPSAAGTFTFRVQATNGVSTPIVTDPITVTISQPPVAPSFTADSPPRTATVSTPYTYTFTASGQPAPTFSVTSGSLPAGLALNPTSGVLSGTPTAPGSSTFTVSAGNGIDSPALSPALTIAVSGPVGPVAFTSPATAAGAVGQALKVSITTSGTPAPAITATGALPAGVTFTDNGDGTATLGGTPAAGTQGSYPVTLAAKNSAGATATQTLTLTIAAAAPSADLAVTMTGPATASVGGALTYTVTVTNGGPAAAAGTVATFTLPAGTTFTSAASGGTFATGTVTWPAVTVNAGSHLNLKVTLAATAKGTTSATGQASATTADPSTANNTKNLPLTIR